MGSVESLNTVWFSLIGVLWAGYFVLEGFDFGVAIVAPVVARDETERRLCVNAVGPTWDGNEVWLIVAGGATFAAFPDWYAQLFSGAYLALFLILVALIVRGVSFEYRGKDPRLSWRTGWDWARFAGSLVPAFLWGVAFTDLLHGLNFGPDGRYHGGLVGLVHPIAILGGLVTLALFCLHGCIFLALKTGGELRARARRVARLLTLPAAALMVGLVVWVAVDAGPGAGTLSPVVPLVMAGVAVLAVLLGGAVVGHDLTAFGLTALGVLLSAGAAFAALFPRVMVATRPARSLTIWNAASAHETLMVMTVVGCIFLPFVLAYQGWSYWVFRQRLVAPPQEAQGHSGSPRPLPGDPVPRS